MTRAAIYVRVSIDHTGEGLAVDRQLKECSRILAERGWDLFKVYRDNNLSASKREGVRPAYLEMERDFEAGAFDALVCWDLDRLTRQPRQLEDWIDAATRRSLRIVTANGEADLDNDNGRMFARIKASVARGEMERKSARQRSANDQRRAAGIPTSGRTPFGYSWVGAAERRSRGVVAAYEIVPDEAATIRRAYGALISGVSLGQIARELNADGKLTRAGAEWRPSTIRRLLLSPFNAGLIPAPKAPGTHYTPDSVDPDTCTPGAWEAIVPRDTWEAARDILGAPARRAHRHGTARKWLLSGLAVCGVCYEPVRSGGGDAGIQSYRCRSMAHFMRRGAPLDAFVESVVVRRLTRPDAAELLLDRKREDVGELRAERSALQVRLDSIAGLIADGTLNADAARQSVRGLREKIAAVDAKLTEARSVEVFGDVVNVPDVAAAWAALSLDRKRAIVDALMTVVVHSVGQGGRSQSMERMAATTEVIWKA